MHLGIGPQVVVADKALVPCARTLAWSRELAMTLLMALRVLVWELASFTSRSRACGPFPILLSYYGERP